MLSLILYKKTPFLRLVLALIAGIVLYKYLTPTWPILAIASIALLSLWLLWFQLSLSNRYILRWCQGLILLLLVTTLGAAITYAADIRNQRYWYGHSYKPGIPILATIKEPLQEKERPFKTIATVSAIYLNNHWQPSKGDIILYIGKENLTDSASSLSGNTQASSFPCNSRTKNDTDSSFKDMHALSNANASVNKDQDINGTDDTISCLQYSSDVSSLSYASRIIFCQPLRDIRSSGNPGQFNYTAWCKLHNWYHQAYLPSGAYQHLSHHKGSVIQSILFSTRTWVTTVLRRYIKDPDAAAIATALLIGERTELDKDLLTAYSRTGVVHIIAISGLHLGLIYGLLVVLLTAAGRLPLRGWWRPLLVLTGLWAFTLLAGAQPSVLRSAVMFTFITIGQVIGKQHNIYNNLAASAFCLLAYNPYMLWDIGFQLSYSAVAGIAVLYKTMYHWPGFGNRLILYLWQMISLTLAAQVFTLPILLYHFHQFPYWFLVSNLVAVPLSGLILYLEIALIMFAWYPPAAGIAGKLVETGMMQMNSFVKYMDRLPFSLTTGIQLSGIQLVLLCLFIICCTSWFLTAHTPEADTDSRRLPNPCHTRKKMYAIIVITCLLLLTQTWELLKASRQQRIVVYQVPQTTAIAIVHGRHAYLLGYDQLGFSDRPPVSFSEEPSTPPKSKSRLAEKQPLTDSPYSSQLQYLQWPAERAVKESQRLWRINKTSFLPENPLTLVNYAGKRLAWIQKGWHPPHQLTPIPVDILVLSHNPTLPLTRVKALFPGALLVFDASNPLWIIEKWKKACDSLHLRFHSVPSDGAFVMEL